MNPYKRGFTAIYGFTSDQQGIRHALLEKDKHQLSSAASAEERQVLADCFMMAQNEAGEP